METVVIIMDKLLLLRAILLLFEVFCGAIFFIIYQSEFLQKKIVFQIMFLQGGQ